MREYYNSFSAAYLDFDQSATLVEFAQTQTGKITLLTLFGCFFMLSHHVHPFSHHPNISWLNWKAVMMYSLTLMTFLPRYRRHILLFTNLYCFNQLPWTGEVWGTMQEYFNLHYSSNMLSWTLLSRVVISAVILFNGFYIYKHYHSQQLTRKSYSVFNLLIITLLLIFIASKIPPGIIQLCLWCFISFQCSIFWFVAYTLKDLKSATHNSINNAKPIWQQLSHYFPIWGSSNTPFPKGAAYLNKIETKTDKDLALSQLSGLRLIIWVYVLYLINRQFYAIIINYHIPSLPQALAQCAMGQPFSAGLEWLILIVYFTSQIFDMCLKGHIIISICKMAGFNAKRNTDRPLLAPTIAEFWNRFYFYYKELLVEMFFYPTYFRFFKNAPKLRIIFATFAAAGFGNVLYHLMSKLPYMFNHGFLNTLIDLQCYYFDAFVLSIGISISQLRKRKLSSNKIIAGIQKYVLSPIIVIGFFALLSVFSTPYCASRLIINLLFVKHLFSFNFM